MTYRNDLDALTARQAALETEVRDRTRELDQARRLVEEISARARLPVLDNIRVAAPCAASWDAMAGDARVRACGDCQKNVYNLSELTREEAENLIREKEGKLCVRYFQRADGTVLLKDCAVGVKRRRRRRIAAVRVQQAHRNDFAMMGSVSAHPLLGALEMPISRPQPNPVPQEAQIPQEAPRPEAAHVTMGKMYVPPSVREVKGELSAPAVKPPAHSHRDPRK
jgi:hypothetical protein